MSHTTTGPIELKKSPAQERVAIAKDVVEQLKMRRLVAESGTYLREMRRLVAESGTYLRELDRNHDGILRGDDECATTRNRDAQKLVKNMRCAVCAKGAIVIAMVDRFDKLKITAGNSVSEELHYIAEMSEESKYVTQLFDSEMLADMKTAFENSRWWRGKCGEYYDDTDRLDAIMRNIIANKGEFVVDDIPPPRKRPISQIVATSAASAAKTKVVKP